MRQLESYADERLTAACIYCGRATQTRDHVPSRVLLNEPYPNNLPVVPACNTPAFCSKNTSCCGISGVSSFQLLLSY
jgi:hypothetical protein